MDLKKSIILLDGEKVVFSRPLEKLVGTECAILLQQLHFIAENPNRAQYHKLAVLARPDESGETQLWVSASYSDLISPDEGLLRSMTTRTIQRAVKRLEERGYLVRQRDPQRLGKTLWRVNYEKLESDNKAAE